MAVLTEGRTPMPSVVQDRAPHHDSRSSDLAVRAKARASIAHVHRSFESLAADSAALVAEAVTRERELRSVIEQSLDLVWLGQARRRGIPARGPSIAGGMDQAPPTRPRCILVVDNRPDSRYLTVRTLMGTPRYDVREAATGREALRLARLADLIILDIKLPDLDGFEVCRRLKADVFTKAIPVFLKTMDDGDRANGLAAGADTYLCDPVEPALLIEAVERLLKHA
jgi:CheY-like chemotaxis protein